MTELRSMLVPLETLSGWPTAQDPTALQALGLLVGLPAVVIIIVFAIAQLRSPSQPAPGTGADAADPVWVGGPERPDIEGPEHDRAAAEAVEIAAEPGKDVGGAGAQW